MQVALAAFWQSVGIEPGAVVGQSMGEVAAAHVAGALSLQDAALVICRRSQIVEKVRGLGAMAVIELPLEACRRALCPHEGRLSVAVSTSPTATVVSGDNKALDELLQSLDADGVAAHRIQVDYASHCFHMDPLQAELEEALGRVDPRAPSVPLYSTVTGGEIIDERLDARYWARNLRQPVLFWGATKRLLEDGFHTYLDVNPHPLLVHSVQQTLETHGALTKAVVLPSLRRGEIGRSVLSDTLGSLFTRGANVHWHRFRKGSRLSGSFTSERLAGEAKCEASKGACELLVLSAHSRALLERRARAFSGWLRGQPDSGLRNVCYTSNVRRQLHEFRLAVVGERCETMAGALDEWCETARYERQEVAPRIVFVFPGQGSQWVGMGRDLLHTEPVFARTIAACEQALAPHVTWCLSDILRTGETESRLDELDVVQPVLWGLGCALAALWRSWGVEPDAVVGHSMGEVAAACIAGALSFEDGARVIATRSRLIRENMCGTGGMAMVELPFATAMEAIDGLEDRVAVAASNGPRSSVLSGELGALDETISKLESQGVFCRRVNVDYASHSPQMDALESKLIEALANLKSQPTSIPLFSTVTCSWVTRILSTGHIGPQFRNPVLFSGAVEKLAADGHDVFLEVSPHPVLLPAIQDGLREMGLNALVLSSTRRAEDERRDLLTSLASLFMRGLTPRFSTLYGRGGSVVSLPTYEWDRERYWVDPVEPEDSNQPVAVRDFGCSELLGSPRSAQGSSEGKFWELSLAADAGSYLREHRVGGKVILPGAVYLEMIQAAAREVFGVRPHFLSGCAFHAALRFPDEGARRLRSLRIPQHAALGGLSARRGVSSPAQAGDPDAGLAAPGDWVLHASAKVEHCESHTTQEVGVVVARGGREARVVSPETHYGWLAARGIEYGASFRGLAEIRIEEEGISVAEVRRPKGVGFGRYAAAHPALLDACMQVLFSLADGYADFGGRELGTLGSRWRRSYAGLWQPGRGLGGTRTSG